MILERSIFYRTRAKDYSSGATSVGPRHTYSSYTSATPNYQLDLEASATGSHQSSESTSILSWSPSTSSSLIHSPIHQTPSPKHLPRPHLRQPLRNPPATSRLLTRQRRDWPSRQRPSPSLPPSRLAY